ncbi:MAG: hypothetical protein CMQ05_00005, partial [Gammaproteobacteria bacterium]|nr:hypothetical protein [Gammaproteobacteria bacterium]
MLRWGGKCGTKVPTARYVAKRFVMLGGEPRLAFVAKQTVPDMPSFVAMETIYLAIQFGVYGL